VEHVLTSIEKLALFISGECIWISGFNWNLLAHVFGPEMQAWIACGAWGTSPSIHAHAVRTKYVRKAILARRLLLWRNRNSFLQFFKPVYDYVDFAGFLCDRYASSSRCRLQHQESPAVRADVPRIKIMYVVHTIYFVRSRKRSMRPSKKRFGFFVAEGRIRLDWNGPQPMAVLFDVSS
jgi:hypothetical protein